MMLAHPYTQVWLAEGYTRRGEPERAISVLDALDAFTQRTGERYFDPWAQKARSLAEKKIAEPMALTSRV